MGGVREEDREGRNEKGRERGREERLGRLILKLNCRPKEQLEIVLN